MTKISRRTIVTAAAAGLVMPKLSFGLATPGRKRSLRFAFATDIHVKPDANAPKGFAACLEQINGRKDRPRLIVTGGDHVMDSLATDADSVKAQWEIFKKTLKDHNALPIRYTVGNHDVFGWSNREKYSSDPRFGKVWACESLELAKPYYSFDESGWHFIVLDSTHEAGGGYTAKLDDEQFEWLKQDLAATPKTTPIVVVGHIPILMVCSVFDGENEKSGNWVIPGSYMHIDARRITDLFLQHPNVKLCLSGHEHQVDRIEFNGVVYFCGGAVCAAWWGGKYYQCTYGYSLIDLYGDGSFDIQYVPYTWN